MLYSIDYTDSVRYILQNLYGGCDNEEPYSYNNVNYLKYVIYFYVVDVENKKYYILTLSEVLNSNRAVLEKGIDYLENLLIQKREITIDEILK
jgi:hypothetical protein